MAKVPALPVPERERLRLFCALQLDAETVACLAAWQQANLARGRIVPPGNLHVTLAFLGTTPSADVDGILEVLREAAAGAPVPALTPVRYRETRSVGMVVFEDAGDHATEIAERVGEGLERLGVYRREERLWLPHVTVLRFRGRPRLVPTLPGLGQVSPSEVALYHSVLRPGGAQYEILESVALGG
jgi:2'-5' RNA ligase